MTVIRALPSPQVREVTTVSEWNSILAEARLSYPPRTVFVDFYATWCGPCKVISPHFATLAVQNPHAYFLRVDVEGADTRRIAQSPKYKVTAMPTFVVISGKDVVTTMKGADVTGLGQLIRTYSNPRGDLPPEVERLRGLGNDGFKSKDYEQAIAHYTSALSHLSTSSTILLNRSLSYYQLSNLTTPPDVVQLEKSLSDAYTSTQLDPRNPKAWYRLSAAIHLGATTIKPDGEKTSGVSFDKDDAIVALQNAITFGKGSKVEQEAQVLVEKIEKGL